MYKLFSRFIKEYNIRFLFYNRTFPLNKDNVNIFNLSRYIHLNSYISAFKGESSKMLNNWINFYESYEGELIESFTATFSPNATLSLAYVNDLASDGMLFKYNNTFNYINSIIPKTTFNFMNDKPITVKFYLPERIMPKMMFYANRTIEKIITNDIILIGAFSFKYSSLKEASFSSDLRFLDDEAFNLCDLSKINLNEGLKEIGYNCFDGCDHISEIRLPSTLINLKKNSFTDCNNIKKIHAPYKLKNKVANAFKDKKNSIIYY